MPEDREVRRRYGDKEVGLILKRAAELQQQEPASVAEGGGLTLTELEEIAGEAGIDARHLRAAAAELEAGPHDEEAAIFLGAPLKVEYERSLAGELPESDFERLLPAIQELAAGYGQASVVGRLFTWQSQSPNSERALLVTVNAGRGRTRIRIEERYSNLAGQLFGGFLGGGGGGVGLGVGLGVGIGALGSVLFTIAFPVATIGASYWLARHFFSRSVRRRQRALRELLDRLTDEALDAIAAGGIERPQQSPQLPTP